MEHRMSLPRRKCLTCRKKNESHVATMYCKQCAEYLCTFCVDGHRIYREGNHDINHVSNDRVNLALNIADCDTHGNTINVYCEHHDVLCCEACKDTEHENCNLCPLEEADVDALLTCIKEMREKIYKVNAIGMQNDALKRDACSKVKALLKEIEQFLEVVKDIFDEIDTYPENEYSPCMEEYKRINDIKMDVDLYTPIENFIAMKKINGKSCVYDKHEHFLKEQNHHLKDVDDFSDEALLTIKCRNSVATVTLNSLKENMPTPPSPVAKIVSLAFEHVLESSLPITHQGIYISGLDITHDDKIVLVERNHQLCFMLNDRFQMFGSEYSLQANPRDVAVVDDTSIAVTVCNDLIKKICICDVSSVSKGGKIILKQTIISPDSCDSVCASRGSLILSSLNTKTAISKVDRKENWGPMKDILLEGNLNDFGSSRCAFDKTMEKVFITDITQNCVYVYSIMDRQTKVVRDSRLCEPRGVVIYLNGTAFVCCTGTNSIVHMTTEGEILDDYKIDIDLPEFISLTADVRHLIVWSNSVGKIQKYKITVVRRDRLPSRQRTDRGVTM